MSLVLQHAFFLLFLLKSIYLLNKKNTHIRDFYYKPMGMQANFRERLKSVVLWRHCQNITFINKSSLIYFVKINGPYAFPTINMRRRDCNLQGGSMS